MIGGFKNRAEFARAMMMCNLAYFKPNYMKTVAELDEAQANYERRNSQPNNEDYECLVNKKGYVTMRIG